MAVPTDILSVTPLQHSQPLKRHWGKSSGGETQEPPIPHVDAANPDIQRWDNGLTLHNDFITPAEEEAILDFVASYPSWTGAGKRITIHFGPHFDYTTFATSATDSTPPPPCLTDLLPRLPTQEQLPDQFTIQYYPPGTGIAPHVDTHSAFGEAIYSISLGCDVPMSFKQCGETEARRARAPKRSLAEKQRPRAAAAPPVRTRSAQVEEKLEAWDVFLPRRSMLVMQGAARYGFTHRIRPRRFDRRDGEVVERGGRLSITMRSIKQGEDVGCDCAFPEVCDSRIEALRREGKIDEEGSFVGER